MDENKIESQVCSLQLSKEIKEAGYLQEGLWFYNSETMKLQRGFTSHINHKGKMCWSIVAPTVAEGWKKLPMAVEREGIIYDLITLKGKDKVEKTIVTYANVAKHITLNALADENPANAIHKMWLYLKKEGLI